jgi:ATP/maltotriose-dependent transcriptional regulator MalT
MARREPDLLQVLANATNRSILSLLAVEPQYPRRLAELVGLTEDEASKRLRMFEKLGLVAGNWEHVGRNVRLYRLESTGIQVQVHPSGLVVTGVGEEPVELLTHPETPPEVLRFVGRTHELDHMEAALQSHRALCIWGLGGVGKTTLAAMWAKRKPPVVWHTVAPGTSAELLLGRLALGLRLHLEPAQGHHLMTLAASRDTALLRRGVVQSMDAVAATVVVDRFEAAAADAGDMLADIIARVQRGRILITSRTLPKGLPRERVVAMELAGLNERDVGELLLAYGTTDPDAAATLYKRTGGHALAVVLAAQTQAARTPARSTPGVDLRDFLVHDILPQLPDGERDTLLALSVLRGSFSVHHAEQMVKRVGVGLTLTRLEHRGMVARHGDMYRVHDLVRTEVAPLAPDLPNLHRLAARVLQESGEPFNAVEALWHLLEAGDVQAAARFVSGEAERQAYRFFDHGLGAAYGRLIATLEASVGLAAQERCAVALQLGMLDLYAGRVDAARRRLEAADHLAATVSSSVQVQVKLAQGRLAHFTGQTEEARARYAEAEKAAAAAGDSDLLLEALVDRGRMEEEHNEEQALEVWMRAMDAGRDATDARLLSMAYSGAAGILARNGDARFLEWAEEGLRLARMSGFLRGEVAAYMTLATHFIAVGDAKLARRHIERYSELSRRLGDPWFVACALVSEAHVLLDEDRVPDALGVAREALAAARQLHSPFYELLASIRVGEALARLGHGKEAREALGILDRVQMNVLPYVMARGWGLLANLLEQEGNGEGASAARAKERQFAKTAAAGGPRGVSMRRAAQQVSDELKNLPPHARVEFA